ncbi:hypothetical protein ACEPPN_011185 [Leptodophora sp. 'Broadleaf-Isolate-01']
MLKQIAFLLRLTIFFNSSFTSAQDVSTQDVGDCTCGFYDADTDLLFTDSTIVYFNETDTIPDSLVVESFEHRYDRGWNALYRQGAAADNVEISNDTTARNRSSLAVYCNPGDGEGLVVGASVRTARQDIFFGSFRSSMRAPRSWFRGSAMSMMLHHNITETWNLDVMNTDNSTQAWVAMVSQGKFADTWLGTNFTDLLAVGTNPWHYVEYRVDWTRDRIDYYIDGVLQRSDTKKLNGTLPSTPAPLKWQHWSQGNVYTTQGPPGKRSQANLGWTRIFFNSSTATKAERLSFDEKCSPAAACLMNDNNLRGSSPHSPASLKPWKQHKPAWKLLWIPLTVDIIFGGLFVLVTTKTLLRRFSMERLNQFLGFSKRPAPAIETPRMSSDSDRNTVMGTNPGDPFSDRTALPESINTSPHSARDLHTISEGTTTPTYSGYSTPAPGHQSPTPSTRRVYSRPAEGLLAAPFPHDGSSGTNMAPGGSSSRMIPSTTTSAATSYADLLFPYSTPVVMPSKSGLQPSPLAKSPITEPEQSKTESKTAPANAAKPGIAAAPRVDYLAGFISMSAILVTVNHFGLTFWAGVIIPSVRPHYQSEIWARKTFANYFLDPLWIGPFLMVSTRFLVSNYLRTGKLENMAQKIVARPFRLLTPVASIATLTYFLSDAGALNWLEYLASVTWSPWPFTVIVKNPGVFISELIQLAYLIPNAAPMITYNYCTGVLWTIPVQLQGAWQTLLALIMIKECKTPWKRFSLYAFCIVNHWYALSWGSYYYAGVLLADLEITFKYKKWLHPRPWVYYPLLIVLILLAIGGFTYDSAVQYTGVQYAQVEYGIHPHPGSGLSIKESGNSVYPDYFIPRLNALVTTVAMQTIVEISPAVQKVLSFKFLQWLFPHVFTIYLIHGFIFWSVGSWAMVSIFSYGHPYWLCCLLVTIICYGVLLASLPILTPPIELLGKNFTLHLWEHASQEPVPRKPTTHPFGIEMLLGRKAAPSESLSDSVSAKNEKTDPFADPFPVSDEKGKPRAEAQVNQF